jgi:hypothetical protein
MRVTMLVFRPHERVAEVEHFDSEPAMAAVEAILGGPLEQVPGFLSIEYQGAIRPCVALCRQGGKRKGMPLNVAATILWDDALRREMGIGLIGRDGKRADQLVGPVIIFFRSS